MNDLYSKASTIHEEHKNQLLASLYKIIVQYPTQDSLKQAQYMLSKHFDDVESLKNLPTFK